MGFATMHRGDLEDMAQSCEEWRNRAEDAELKINAWGPRMLALEARCSELVALLKLHTTTEVSKEIIRQTEALLRANK